MSSGDGVNGDQPQALGNSGSHQEQSSKSPMKGVGQQGSPKCRVPSPDSDPIDEFESISFDDGIAHCTLEHLIKKFRDNQYNTNDVEGFILMKCKLLFERDYELEVVKNDGISANYPKELLIPIARKNAPENEKPMNFDAESYSKLAHKALGARVRARVVVPAILFDNKFVCRSGSLTVWLSAAYEIAKSGLRISESQSGLSKLIEVANNAVQCITNADFMTKLQAADLEMMEYLNVEYICDLMVEHHKIYKKQICVSATETVHGETYKNMKVQELPFPGCEFFLEYKNAGRESAGLVFDWDQSELTRNLELTDDLKVLLIKIDLTNWKTWDLNDLTYYHMMIMISCLVSGESGMNVHCISGWDRTPLFVSLLRLSLWADGLIHESLNPEEMAYFTLAYDWYLFGHALPDRLAKGEEIMHFAFNFLQYMTDERFSLPRMFQKLTEEEKRGRNIPIYEGGRRKVLLEVRTCVLDAYNEHIISRLESTAHSTEAALH